MILQERPQVSSELNEPMFSDREDAIAKLIEVLPKDKIENDNMLIVCISTQAVPVAEEIAKKFNLSYDLLFSEHIYAPNNKECVIGMVSETEEIVLHDELVDSFGINLDFIYGEAHRKYEEKILPCVYKFRKGDLISSLKDKNVLLIDEGCETGMTVMVAIKTAISGGAKSVAYATPLLSVDVEYSLEPVTDEIFFVHKISSFIDVDFYYKALKELDTDEVLEIIGSSTRYLPFQKRGEK